MCDDIKCVFVCTVRSVQENIYKEAKPPAQHPTRPAARKTFTFPYSAIYEPKSVLIGTFPGKKLVGMGGIGISAVMASEPN